MRLLAGTTFVFVVMVAILSLIIDFRTGVQLDMSQMKYAAILLLAGAGFLGFMWITGHGFSNKPKVSKYDH